MVEEKIVEEIYSVLVERFGIGEVFLPKYRKRKVDIAWKDFIKAALEMDSTEELATYCGYTGSTSFSVSLSSKKDLKLIRDSKGKSSWCIYFYELIHKKACYKCNIVLDYTNFSSDSSRRDGYNSICKKCDNSHKKNYYTINKEKIITYRLINRDSRLERSREYYQENKEYISKRKSEYFQTNKYLFSSYRAKRRATKLKATPAWADQEKIKQIYKERPEGYHVDHIVPLQNDLVCGLHCEFNLQYLTAAENLSKSNKFDIDKQE